MPAPRVRRVFYGFLRDLKNDRRFGMGPCSAIPYTSRATWCDRNVAEELWDFSMACLALLDHEYLAWLYEQQEASRQRSKAERGR